MAKDLLTRTFTALGFEVKEDYGTWAPLVDSIIIRDPKSNFQTVFKWKVTKDDTIWYVEHVGPQLKTILLKGIGFDHNTEYSISSLDEFIKRNQ
jgi:hypothetical protein